MSCSDEGDGDMQVNREMLIEALANEIADRLWWEFSERMRAGWEMLVCCDGCLVVWCEEAA